MTEKLYYLQSHLRHFTATVLSCEQEGGAWSVVLDRTAFFAEGGGQHCDNGVLGGANVLSVKEKDGIIRHSCDAPLPVGEEVEGEIDWEARFGRMQLHSGEHIVSGIAHQHWGCENVGFHMSEDFVTIDFDVELSAEQIRELEAAANEAVWANLPFVTFFPTPEELELLPYRSKKELSGQVRIVEVEGVDRCACCAPHVERSGEVGMIRLTDAMRHRGGVRLTMKSGRFAFADAAARGADMAALSALLSVPKEQVRESTEKLFAETENLRFRLAHSEKARMEQLAAAAEPTEGNLCFFEGETDRDALRALVNAAGEKCLVAAAFAGEDGAWQYVIGSRTVDLRAAAKALNGALRGRGGGSREMIQGSCAASRTEIERFMEDFHG